MRRYRRRYSRKSTIRLPAYPKRYRKRYRGKESFSFPSAFLLFIVLIGGFFAVTNYLNEAPSAHKRTSYSSSAAVSYPSYTFAPVKSSSPAPSPSPAPTSAPITVSPEVVNRIAASIVNAFSNPQGTPQSASTPFMTPAPTKAPSPTSVKRQTQAVSKTAAPRATAASTPIPGTNYVLNRNTKRFHKPTCRDVKKIKDSNRVDYFGTYKEVTQMGYKPCGHCNPH